MIESGAVFADEAKISDFSAVLDEGKLQDGIILRKGKKSFVRVTGKK
jgi:tyrosyl-tRNA synthetase